MDKHLEILKNMGIDIKTLKPGEQKKQIMEICNMTEEDWEAQKESFNP